MRDVPQSATAAGPTDGPHPSVSAGLAPGPREPSAAPPRCHLIERNVPTLFNVGFNGLVSGTQADPAAAPMFWDSRVQEGLEQQVFAPLTSWEKCARGCLRKTKRWLGRSCVCKRLLSIANDSRSIRASRQAKQFRRNISRKPLRLSSGP